jgi:hypothetical protein
MYYICIYLNVRKFACLYICIYVHIDMFIYTYTYTGNSDNTKKDKGMKNDDDEDDLLSNLRHSVHTISSSHVLYSPIARARGIYIFDYVYTCIHLWTNLCIFMFTYKHMYIYICVYMHMCAHAYICIYTLFTHC